MVDIDVTQAADVMIITHEAHEPQVLTRISASEFELSDLEIFNAPEHNFNDDDSPASQDEIQLLKIRNMDDYIKNT